MDGDTLYLVNRLLEMNIVCKVDDIVSIDYNTFMADVVITLSNTHVIKRHKVEDPIKILDAFANILYGNADRKMNKQQDFDIPNLVSLITDDDVK